MGAHLHPFTRIAKEQELYYMLSICIWPPALPTRLTALSSHIFIPLSIFPDWTQFLSVYMRELECNNSFQTVLWSPRVQIQGHELSTCVKGYLMNEKPRGPRGKTNRPHSETNTHLNRALQFLSVLYIGLSWKVPFWGKKCSYAKKKKKNQMGSYWPACLLSALQILISNMSIRKEWLIENDYSFLGRLVLCWKEIILHITSSSKQSSFTELCREIFGWVLLSSWSMRWKSSVL